MAGVSLGPARLPRLGYPVTSDHEEGDRRAFVGRYVARGEASTLNFVVPQLLSRQPPLAVDRMHCQTLCDHARCHTQMRGRCDGVGCDHDGSHGSGGPGGSWSSSVMPIP
jgi:hypothetical protein